MIRSRALWVLAQLARAENPVTVRRALYRGVDPAVRGRVRRLVEKRVAEVLLESEHAADEAHVHRAAFLVLAGRGDDGTLTQDALAARFEEVTADLREPSRWGATLTLGGLSIVLLAAVGGATWWLTRPPPALRETLAESTTAWTEGGRPRSGSPAVTTFFETDFPEWVVQLDRVRRAREAGPVEQTAALQTLDGASGALLARSRAIFGADMTSFLHAVLDQARALVIADEAPAADSHVRSVDAFNAAIADRGLAYYVDAEVLTSFGRGAIRNRVYLSTFRVRRVRFYEGPEAPVRVLMLRRLDHLNIGRQVLGFTREQVRDALVLEERVERHMVDYVLPSLGAGARMPLVDRESTVGLEWVAPLERAAAEDARAAAEAIVGETAVALGEVLARRQRLLDQWQDRFGDDLVIVRPRGFDFDPARYAAIEARVPHSEWRELEAIADDLEEAALRQAYGALEAAFAGSVERHEAQHRLDFAAGTLRVASPPLDERFGPVTREDGSRNPRAWRRRAELSAYLSEIARAPELAKVNLSLIGRHLYLRHAWGTPESTGTVLIFEGLARELGIEHEPLVVRRRVDRGALAALHLALRERSGEALAAAARAAWEGLFASQLPPLNPR